MYARALTAILLMLSAVFWENARAQVRSIAGTYKNFALGYAIQIPRGLKGVTGGDAGPERGVEISLPWGAKIDVWGEPNSLEWTTPEESVDHELALKDCESRDRDLTATFVGKRKGARGRLVCDDRVLVLLMAFPSRGGPIYRLRLETTLSHEREDRAVLESIAASFRLIPWK